MPCPDLQLPIIVCMICVPSVWALWTQPTHVWRHADTSFMANVLNSVCVRRATVPCAVISFSPELLCKLRPQSSTCSVSPKRIHNGTSEFWTCFNVRSTFAFHKNVPFCFLIVLTKLNRYEWIFHFYNREWLLHTFFTRYFTSFCSFNVHEALRLGYKHIAVLLVFSDSLA